MPQPTTQTKTPSTPSITKSEKLKYFISLSESSSSFATTTATTTTTNKKENKQYVCDVVETTNDEKQKNQKDQRHSNKHAGSARL